MIQTVYTLIGLVVAALFYVAVPGVGAFLARSKWRRFRNQMAGSALLPILREADERQNAASGRFRFYGRLQAIQGRDRIWLSSMDPGSSRAGVFSVAVDLERVQVYILPGGEPGFGDDEPQGLPWKNISTLPAGTQVFVAGSPVQEEGRAVFRPTDESPLLLAFYEGPAESLLGQAVWCGRQRNEYWNSFTGISLITGFVALFLLGYLLLRDPLLRFPALISFTLSSAPLAALLPPGVLFLYLYDRFWKRGRSLRAERDLFRLPLSYFEGEVKNISSGYRTSLPDGEPYLMLHGEPQQLEAMADGPLEKWESSLKSKDSVRQGRLFGATDDPEAPNPRVSDPKDPMAVCVLFQGDPVALSAAAASRARRYEVLSALFFALDIVPNLILVLIVLYQMAW